MKKSQKKYKFIIKLIFKISLFFLVLLILILCYSIYPVKFVNAQDDVWQGDPLSIAGVNAIVTRDPITQKINWRQTLQDWSIYLKEHYYEVLRDAIKKTAALAYKAALRNFLNNLAYDTATYLATGEKGQNPMFQTENIGDYLRNTADSAAGTFLETLGKENGYLKFNLCQPDFQIGLKIGLGLLKTKRPTKPTCTFTEMKKNWEKELKDPNFLPKFQDMFNPWSNDLGIALSLQTGIIETQQREEHYKGLDYQINQGIHAVVDPISGRIKTPSGAVKEQMGVTIQEGTSLYKVYTGDAVADAIGIFINTLSGQLIEKWLKKGLVTTFPQTGYDFSKLSFEGEAGKEGVAGAKSRFRTLIEPNFSVRGDYNILAELTMCADPNKAGPTNCVIDEKFRQAIENKLTVGEALKQGYLNGNGVFGFNSDGLEPRYNEGYPYRSMIILRKFRIIPVGWEVAAQFIKDNPGNIDGTKNLADLVACFSSGDDYTGYNANWCQGLVDPNWVLKAPLNFCKREGPGPEIMSDQVIGEGASSKRSILRNDKYCGDEQSCIKEASDGSCQLYGYCTEERNKWVFTGTKACEPRNNTCQTFRGPAGQTVSYLENTLDYDSCNIDNAGCKDFCTDYDLASESFSCTATTGNKIYLDKNAEVCESTAEGCHEYIRLKSGQGANLLTNSSFEQDIATSIWNGDGTWTNQGYDGNYSLGLSASLTKTINVASVGYSISGEVFSLSFYAKNCTAGDDFRITGQGNATPLAAGADWQFYYTSYIVPTTSGGNQIGFTSNSSSCLIDAIKLERAGQPTGYNDYRGSGLIYQRLAPAYLGCDGTADPAECKNYIRTCSAQEVGCELYTSTVDSISIPAKVLAQDYCPAECLGYDTYIQAATTFDSLRDAYFIPRTAKTCGAPEVGCDQFTNLDEVARGGEGIEYYTYLRQCIKPSLTDCAEYYSWEGSDESGYQLKVYSLKVDLATGEPAVTQNDALECNETIYNLPATDPNYNPDCRQFYNRAGQLSFHLYKRTISCSDDCHPYRRTEINTDPAITASASCQGTDKYWDSVSSQCVVCKAGGLWDASHGACLYQSIPSQGVSCPASQAGCREYTGNSGANMRFILNNDFEGSLQGWTGIGGTTVSLSSDSLIVGGNSMLVSGGIFTATTSVGQLVQQNKAYILTFLAKASTANQLTNIRLINSAGQTADFTTTALTSDWRYYKVNLTNLGHPVDDRESLVITANGGFYLDNLRLTEIIDRYYLIKNSWVTPASCDQDTLGNPYPLYMLGCQAYLDREGKNHNLHNFSYLCQDSSVGCELMIDTQNSTDYASQTFSMGAVTLTVPADNFVYVVYDRNKQCNQADKGCQFLGLPYQYLSDLIYRPTYLKNDPDKYSQILCQDTTVGCEEWTTEEGKSSYFKDPAETICEWRQGAGLASNSWGWYMKKIKRCDDGSNGGLAGNGEIEAAGAPLAAKENKICLTDKDCASAKCILDENDYGCPTNSLKTFGYGGQGNQVEQPQWGWAGTCPAAETSCSEYLDPVSRFNSNLIFNSDFSQDVDLDNQPDGWTAGGGTSYSQEVSLENYTLYRLAGKSHHEFTIKFVCPISGSLAILTANNSLDNPINNISLSVAGGNIIYSYIFYNNSQQTCSIEATDGIVVGSGDYVELKKVIVDYQLGRDVDKTSCNGVVDFEQGCVLFNERAQNGKVLAGLVWDADVTIDDSNGKPPSKGNLAQINTTADANTILKVTPDRVCNKWLACRSYVKDEKGNNVCFDIGLCDGVDANGNCNNFIIAKQENQTHPAPYSATRISNYSGYNKVGLAGGSLDGDYYSFGAMKQIGEMAMLSNSGFEIAGTNGYPLGWYWTGGAWNENVFKVINNPIEAQNEGVGNAPEGNNFLKLGSSFSAASEFVDVVGSVGTGIPYVLTAYINTINLKSGSAKIKAEAFNSAGQSQGVIDLSPEISLAGGNSWTFKLGKFTINNPQISRIKITLYSDSDTQGNFYFDDIQIKPSLNSRKDWYTPQSCRLYPQTDSLACDYYDDSGKYQKGSSGYCLEYDRYPGSSDACLLWWPTDKVKGEGIEEGAGYTGKIPVYYCDEAIVKINEPTVPFNSQGLKNIYWANQTAHGDISGGFVVDYPKLVIPGGNYEIRNATGRGPKAAILENNADMLKISGGDDGCHMCFSEALYSFDLYDSGTNEKVFHWEGNIDITLTIIFTRVDVYCSKLVKTVSEVGQNKFWSSKVYSGSDFTFPCKALNVASTSIIFADTVCAYDTNATPFGSIAVSGDTVASIVNPYEWDGSQNAGIQPLYYIDLESEPRVGWLHEEERIKRIFAQSYGAWQWTGTSTNGRYEVAQNLDWGPPASVCPGGTRPAYPGDYCAILPVITNIKANDNTGNIILTKNQFVNLTFNSNVDKEQLPIIMYGIDWADGEKTVVSGVEMRNRPNADNPHSFYHLYSYWDLRSKYASGPSSITCVSGGGFIGGYQCPSGNNCCGLRPQAMIKDNWGWCNGGIALNDCDQWEVFNGWVIVKEK